MELSDQEFWDCKELFNEQFKKLADEFLDQLELGKGSKRKYDLILAAFVDYIYI